MKSMQKGVKKYPKLAYKQWINFEDWGGKGAKQYRTIYDIWKTSNKDTIFSVYYTKFLPKMQVIHTNNARLTIHNSLLTIAKLEDLGHLAQQHLTLNFPAIF